MSCAGVTGEGLDLGGEGEEGGVKAPSPGSEPAL